MDSVAIRSVDSDTIHPKMSTPKGDGLRISELSRASGVSIPTIKFYLREGMLPAGRLINQNQALYSEDHARRLRLIRALVEVGGLPLATVRRILHAADDPDLSIHEALGIAQRALSPNLGAQGGPAVDEARAEVDRFLDELGWQVAPDSPGRQELAVALSTLRRLGWPNADTRLFTRYAKAADRLASVEVSRTTPPGSTRTETMERVVIGTVVFGAVFSALRRLSHERHSAARLGMRS
jgi:DNA-binding transcriptional MerR regulator